MKDYKRLTTRDLVGTYVNMYEFANEVKKWQERHGLYDYMGVDATQILLERLADLEDKIENGTLVEMGYHIQKSYRNHDDQRYKIVLIDEIEIDEIGYDGLTKAEAEAKLRELKEKD